MVALIAGWIVTEVGRQPWIVYEFMRTEEAVTGADGIPVGYATLVVVYVALCVRGVTCSCGESHARGPMRSFAEGVDARRFPDAARACRSRSSSSA